MYKRYQRGITTYGGKSSFGLKVIKRADAKKLGLPSYFTGLPCIKGHISERYTYGACIACSLERAKDKYDPVARAVYSKAWYKENAEQQREKCRRYHASHRKERSIHRRLRRALSDVVRDWERKRTAQRRIEDLDFCIMKALRARTLSAIKRGTKSGSAIRDLGCSIAELKVYIARKFKRGMSWDNWPIKWHLDHIRPLASFDLTDRKQFLVACHYTNLQPLGVVEHREKSSRERACLISLN